jgi:hypothetical protein
MPVYGARADAVEYVGDVDGDGSITPKDVTKLRRYLAGGWGVDVATEDGDVDEDGAITPKDVTKLRRYLAGGWGIILPQKNPALIEGVSIDKNNFPDNIFREYVINNFDENDDGILEKEEIKSVKEIYVNGLGLSDLKGIEYFTELRELYCSDNRLTSLDLSQNSKLDCFECDGNAISYVDIPASADIMNGWGYTYDKGVKLRYNLGIIDLSDILVEDPLQAYNDITLDSNYSFEWKVSENGTPTLYFKEEYENGYLKTDGELSIQNDIKLETENTYDEKGRIVKRINHEYEYVDEYEYDNNDRVIKEKRSEKGVLTDEKEYTYYSDGTQKTSTAKGKGWDGTPRTQFMEYGPDGKLISGYIETPSGKTGEYTTEYDDNGKVIRIVDDRFERWNNAIIIYDFDENGDMIRRTTKEFLSEGNFLETVREITYDEQGRLITGFEYLDDHFLGEEWFFAEYTYDSMGRIIKKYYMWDDTLEFNRTFIYEYDENNRIISEDYYEHNWDTGHSHNTKYIYEEDTDVIQKTIYTTSPSYKYDAVTTTEYSNGVIIRKTTIHIDDDGNDIGYLYIEEYIDGKITESLTRETLDGETIIKKYDSEENSITEDDSEKTLYDDKGRLIYTKGLSISYYDEGSVITMEIIDDRYVYTYNYSFDKETGMIKKYKYYDNGNGTGNEIIIDSDWNIILTHIIVIRDNIITTEYYNDKEGRELKRKDIEWKNKQYEAVYEYFDNEKGTDCRKALKRYSDGSIVYSLESYGDNDGKGYWAYERNTYGSDGSYCRKLYKYNKDYVEEDPYVDIKIDPDGKRYILDIYEWEYIPITDNVIIY